MLLMILVYIFLAKKGIMVVKDIEREDVEFICKTIGCTPVAHID